MSKIMNDGGHDVTATILAARSFRRRCNLSQTEFAARYGLSKQTYAQWECGRRKPDAASELWLRTILTDSEFAARIAGERAA
jgi:DNA-binding transcriptional regulator YiaG